MVITDSEDKITINDISDVVLTIDVSEPPMIVTDLTDNYNIDDIM